MYGQDDPYDQTYPGDGAGPTQPTDPGPVEFIGYDPSGQPVYRGANGTLYTDDATGVNGLGLYSGDGSNITPPNTTGVPAPTPSPTPGGGGAPAPGGNLGDFNAPFPGTTGNGVEDVPEFQFDDFHAPNQQDVENDQGYQFMRGQGLQALSQNQAASGLANTGGSIKDFINYGQSLASTRYNDVFSRDKSVYDTNYRKALDAFNPKMMDWAARSAANQHGNDAAWQHIMDDWNRRFQMAQA